MKKKRNDTLNKVRKKILRRQKKCYICKKGFSADDNNKAPGLAWQACLKKVEVELELITNFDMLFMTEKGIRVGICHAIHR